MVKNIIALAAVTLPPTVFFVGCPRSIAPAVQAQAASVQPQGGKIRLAAREVARWKIGRSDIVPGSVSVSPNNRRVAFVVNHGNKQCVEVDGKQGKEYYVVSRNSIVFSPDSKSLAYMAGREDGQGFVVVNEVAGRNFDRVTADRSDVVVSPRFSPDSRHVAYAAERENKKYVVVDGVEGEPLIGVDQIADIVFSPDSKRIAYGVGRGEKQWVVVEGKAGKEYDGIGEGSLRFSPDSKRVVYVAHHGDNQLVVVDGIPGKEYDTIEYNTLAISPDSRKVAYAAQLNGVSHVVLDGVEGKGYTRIMQGIIFSPDSKHLAYVAGVGNDYDLIKKWHIVLDKAEGKTYDRIGMNTLAFSPDGKRLAYAAGDEDGKKWWVVVNGHEGKQYDAISNQGIAFTADGQHVIYGASTGLGQSVDAPMSGTIAMLIGNTARIVVDKEEIKGYDSFLRDTKWVFDSPKSFHFLAVRAPGIVCVEVEIVTK